MEGRASPMLPPPAPLSPLSPVSSFASLQPSASSSHSSSNLIKPNTQKDLPSSPRLAAIGGSGAFWGGQTGFGGFGGITPVHTTIIPETTFGEQRNATGNLDRSNENMNPALNHVQVPLAVASNKVFAADQNANSNAQQVSQQTQQSQQNSVALGQLLAQLNGFDNFSDVNPFTLKSLDTYRMQLWQRLAMQSQQQRMRAAQQQSSASHVYPSPPSANTSPASSPSPSGSPVMPGLSGLASGLRPHFFTSSPTPASAAANKVPLFSNMFPASKGLSGSGSYHVGHGLPTPPSSPRTGLGLNANSMGEKEKNAVQHAMLATLASQTVLQKMGQAFWDAFSGSSSSSKHDTGANGVRNWDADKVRKVLDGSAVLRVVDVEPSTTPSSAKKVANTESLEESMKALSLSGEEKREEKKGGIFARMNCSKSKCSSYSTCM